MAAAQTIAVIGAGRVGRGIAQAAAGGGYRTILEDLLPNALRRAESEIRSQLNQAVEAGGVSAVAASAALSRLEFAGSVEDAARQADLVIEPSGRTGIEDRDLHPARQNLPPRYYPGLPHFHPEHYRDFPRHVPCPELCGHAFCGAGGARNQAGHHPRAETDDATVAVAVEVGRRMGKEPVVIQDSVPGPALESATWQ